MHRQSCLYTCPSEHTVHMSICMSVHMSICMPIRMSPHMSPHMSLRMPMHMPIHMPIHMSTYLKLQFARTAASSDALGTWTCIRYADVLKWVAIDRGCFKMSYGLPHWGRSSRARLPASWAARFRHAAARASSRCPPCWSINSITSSMLIYK